MCSRHGFTTPSAPNPLTVTYSFIADDQTQTVTTRIERVAGGAYVASCEATAPILVCRTTSTPRPRTMTWRRSHFDLDYKSTDPEVRLQHGADPDLWGDLIDACTRGAAIATVCARGAE